MTLIVSRCTGYSSSLSHDQFINLPPYCIHAKMRLSLCCNMLKYWIWLERRNLETLKKVKSRIYQWRHGSCNLAVNTTWCSSWGKDGCWRCGKPDNYRRECPRRGHRLYNRGRLYKKVVIKTIFFCLWRNYTRSKLMSFIYHLRFIQNLSFSIRFSIGKHT